MLNPVDRLCLSLNVKEWIRWSVSSQSVNSAAVDGGFQTDCKCDPFECCRPIWETDCSLICHRGLQILTVASSEAEASRVSISFQPSQLTQLAVLHSLTSNNLLLNQLQTKALQ